MDSEQTKQLVEPIDVEFDRIRLGWNLVVSIPDRDNLLAVLTAFRNHDLQLSRRLDLLESAMSKPHTVLAPATRTPPSFELPNDVATPAPAAEQHLVASRQPDGTIDVDVVSAPPPADVVSRKEVEELLNGGWDPAQMRARLRRIPSSPAPDVRAEAEMEMWKRCREAVRLTPVADLPGIGCIPAASRCLAAIDACKPTAPAGTGGEGGGK